MAEKKPNLHKTLLILLLVFIPPYWLLFTDEGGRVSDTALLWLLGEDDIKLSIAELDDRYSRDDIRNVYSDIEWQCSDATTPFGDGLCSARIGTFNSYPSRSVTFYFERDRLSAMQLIYREPYHEQILGHLIGQHGQPGNVARAIAEGPEADSVLEWQLPHGVVVLKKTLTRQDEPALLWLAGRPAA